MEYITPDIFHVRLGTPKNKKTRTKSVFYTRYKTFVTTIELREWSRPESNWNIKFGDVRTIHCTTRPKWRQIYYKIRQISERLIINTIIMGKSLRFAQFQAFYTTSF